MRARLRLVWWMNVISNKSEQVILPGFGNVTSLPGSEAGALRSGSLDGRMTNQSQPSAAHASRLAALDLDWQRLTRDTCGRTQETLLASAGLQSALENRLRARWDLNGSMEFGLIWKRQAVGLRRPICALRASARRNGDSGCGGHLF